MASTPSAVGPSSKLRATIGAAVPTRQMAWPVKLKQRARLISYSDSAVANASRPMPSQSPTFVARRIGPLLAKVSDRPRHDFLHDLARAAVDPLHPGVAPEAGDGVLVHVAGAAVELEGGVADLPLQLGVEELGGRGFGGGEFLFQVPRD